MSKFMEEFDILCKGSFKFVYTIKANNEEEAESKFSKIDEEISEMIKQFVKKNNDHFEIDWYVCS